MVLGLVTDLMFTSRIREAAKQLGLPCETVRSGDALVARLRESTTPPSVVLVDLDARGVDAVEAIRQVRGVNTDLPVVAYVQHTHVELSQAATLAGADQVVTRGQLTKWLPELLSAKR